VFKKHKSLVSFNTQGEKLDCLNGYEVVCQMAQMLQFLMAQMLQMLQWLNASMAQCLGKCLEQNYCMY
jgi:hypothetical protein